MAESNGHEISPRGPGESPSQKLRAIFNFLPMMTNFPNAAKCLIPQKLIYTCDGPPNPKFLD